MENTKQLIPETEEKIYNLKNDIIFQAFLQEKEMSAF